MSKQTIMTTVTSFTDYRDGTIAFELTDDQLIELARNAVLYCNEIERANATEQDPIARRLISPTEVYNFTQKMQAELDARKAFANEDKAISEMMHV